MNFSFQKTKSSGETFAFARLIAILTKLVPKFAWANHQLIWPSKEILGNWFNLIKPSDKGTASKKKAKPFIVTPKSRAYFFSPKYAKKKPVLLNLGKRKKKNIYKQEKGLI